jgi:methionyl aminopeptidase
MSEFITLKDHKWLSNQQYAGQCVADIFKECQNLILQQTPNLSLKNLELIVYEKCKNHNCVPTFLNYKGFPSAACISVNNTLVHGIVSDYMLQPGDLVTIDVGATFEGAICDSARTWIYGPSNTTENTRMVRECYNALLAGQEMVKIGNRLGAIGNAIYKYATRKGFGVITNYGGHGLDWNKPHADPFVANKQDPNSGIRLENGLSIAVEPMLVMGEVKTKVLDDGWAVTTTGLNCHFENSVTLMDDKLFVMVQDDWNII